MTELRIGTGFDVHKIIPGNGLYLGGFFIEAPFTLEGHSDADLLIHAIADAILGALALDDIGTLFPDSADENKGRPSRDFLVSAVRLINEKGYRLVNIDSTLVCEKPKIIPFRQKIRESLAEIMGIETGQVNVKGKTSEKLGFTGRSEGIVAQAVALLERKKD